MSVSPPGWFCVASKCVIVANSSRTRRLQTWSLSVSAASALLFLYGKRKGQRGTHTFRRRESGSLNAMTGEVFSLCKCSLSIVGVWATFSLPSRFSWTSWALSISFDLLKRGSELNLRPQLRGGALRYLSTECRKPRRKDLLYSSPDLFLASA